MNKKQTKQHNEVSVVEHCCSLTTAGAQNVCRRTTPVRSPAREGRPLVCTRSERHPGHGAAYQTQTVSAAYKPHFTECWLALKGAVRNGCSQVPTTHTVKSW